MRRLGAILLLLLFLSASSAARDIRDLANQLCASRDLNVEALFDRAISKQGVTSVVKALAEFRERYGPCQRIVRKKGPRVEFIHERGVIPARLYIGATQKISGIWFGSAKRIHDSIGAIAKELKQLSGTVAFTAKQMGKKTYLSMNASLPLAVGSAFKLVILRALKDRIDRGQLRWSDIIKLREEWRSLSSGMLQDWPMGAPLTVQSLATLMISKSDNTATDHLLFYLGRNHVERYGPPRNRPLLSTGEMFKLKSTQGSKLARRYAKSDKNQRRQLLQELHAIRLEDLEIKGSPVFVRQIEWFLSTEELCQLIYTLRELDLLGVNPGLADKRQWERTRYKGGSEPGVLNATHLLQHRKTRKWICVSATWNDPIHNVTFQRFADLLKRALHLLEGPLDSRVLCQNPASCP